MISILGLVLQHPPGGWAARIEDESGHSYTLERVGPRYVLYHAVPPPSLVTATREELTMTLKEYLDTAKAVITAVENDLLDPTTGHFKAQPDFVDDSKLVTDVNAAYLANGGTEAPNVGVVVQGVVAVLAIANNFVKPATS